MIFSVFPLRFHQEEEKELRKANLEEKKLIKSISFCFRVGAVFFPSKRMSTQQFSILEKEVGVLASFTFSLSWKKNCFSK